MTALEAKEYGLWTRSSPTAEPAMLNAETHNKGKYSYGK